MDSDPLVADYLHRLDAAAASLPRQRRDELTAEIREHIDTALRDANSTDEVMIRNVLERLGTPDEIVAAASAQSATAEAVERQAEVSRLTITALVVLSLGFVIPFFGWLAGVILVLASGAWSGRDKVVGVVLGLVSVPLLVSTGSVFLGPNHSLGPLELMFVLWGFVGVVSAAYFALRLRHRHRFQF